MAAADSVTPPESHQFAFPLPYAPTTNVHAHLTVNTSSLLLFLTTTSSEAGSGQTSTPMGSFVYAMPDRANTNSPPISTPLYPQPSSLDFTTRVAKVLAKRTNRPVYVGCSVSFAGTGLGGTVEEEMAGFKRIVDVVDEMVQGKIKMNE